MSTSDFTNVSMGNETHHQDCTWINPPYKLPVATGQNWVPKNHQMVHIKQKYTNIASNIY